MPARAILSPFKKKKILCSKVYIEKYRKVPKIVKNCQRKVKKIMFKKGTLTAATRPPLALCSPAPSCTPATQNAQIHET